MVGRGGYRGRKEGSRLKKEKEGKEEGGKEIYMAGGSWALNPFAETRGCLRDRRATAVRFGLVRVITWLRRSYYA